MSAALRRRERAAAAAARAMAQSREEAGQEVRDLPPYPNGKPSRRRGAGG